MTKVKLKILVKDLQAGDAVLGLQVTDAQPRRHGFTRVEFENGVSLPMESEGEITVERDMEIVEEGTA